MKRDGCSPNYYGRILVTLHRLKELYPTYNMGRHLSTVFDGCGDIWGITDKELLRELQEYKKQLEIDVSPHNEEEEEIEEIIKTGMNLRIDTLIEEDNNGYDK